MVTGKIIYITAHKRAIANSFTICTSNHAKRPFACDGGIAALLLFVLASSMSSTLVILELCMHHTVLTMAYGGSVKKISMVIITVQNKWLAGNVHLFIELTLDSSSTPPLIMRFRSILDDTWYLALGTWYLALGNYTIIFSK